jgi:ATP-grasp domain, R2K clade family 3
VDAEYRFFVVAGKVISGSMYRPWGDPVIPDDLMDFAAKALNSWTPAPVFVLDIGRVDSSWKIIECNCFNWSRFYQSNTLKVVHAVSEYQQLRRSHNKRIESNDLPTPSLNDPP